MLGDSYLRPKVKAPVFKIKQVTVEDAKLRLGLSDDQLKVISRCTSAVMNEIVPDLLTAIGKSYIDRYDVVECVCDADRLAEEIRGEYLRQARVTGTDHRVALVEAKELNDKLSNMSIEDHYGVVGIYLTSSRYCM